MALLPNRSGEDGENEQVWSPVHSIGNPQIRTCAQYAGQKAIGRVNADSRRWYSSFGSRRSQFCSQRKSSGNSSRCVTSSATSTRTKRMNTSGIIRRSHSRITAQSVARSVNSMPPSTRMRRSRILKNILKSNLLKMNAENNLYHREMKLFRMLHQRKQRSLQKLSRARVWQRPHRSPHGNAGLS